MSCLYVKHLKVPFVIKRLLFESYIFKYTYINLILNVGSGEECFVENYNDNIDIIKDNNCNNINNNNCNLF